MATTTPYYGATLPSGTDRADVNVLNDNTTLWDLELHNESVRAAANIANIYDATATYTVGEFCTYLGVLYKCTTNTASPAGAFDGTEWEQVNATDEAVDWDAFDDLGAKNLLPYPYNETTKTQNGITYTVNSDGTITVSGATTTNGADFNVTTLTTNNPFENLLLTGCPQGGSISGFFMRDRVSDNGTYVKQFSDTGEGVLISSTDESYEHQIKITVVRNTVISEPITFKPMIRPVSVKDSTYVPYAMTNKKLTGIVKCNQTTAGTYTLQATVDSNGAVTYEWVSTT